jgi:hypothetical protein
MRRLVCAVAVSFGMLMGCGGDVAMDAPDTLGAVEQGLACKYPDNYCAPGTVCVVDTSLCRPACPSSGICSNGSACLISSDGTSYCAY